MYIGPWQEMHLSRVVASLRAADGADEQRKHLTMALQAASSSRRKLRDVSGLPSLSTGGQSTLISTTTATPPSSILDLNDEDISTTTSNSPHSRGHFSTSTSLSSSLSQSGMSIISGHHSNGGREGEGKERRGVGVLDSSASISFVLGGGAKKKSVPSSISSSSSSSSTNSGVRKGYDTSSSVNTHPPISTALQSKTSISQVERMRRLYVSGGTIGEEEDEEDKPKITSELDNELQSLTSFSFHQHDLPISKNQKEKDTSFSHIVTSSDDVILGTTISPKKHGQTERERRLLELIAVQAAQQEALSGQLQHQARVQAAVQNRLMRLLQEDDGIQSKETSRITKIQTSPLGSPTRVYLDTTILRNSPKLKSTMGQTMSTTTTSSSSSSSSSPRIIKSTNKGISLFESPKGQGENEVLAELEADLERLGIDVTRQDHLMVESPPPNTNNSSTRLPLVSEHSHGNNTSIMTTSDTDVTTAASATAATATSLYMSQQQQQYMQWLQWQNYYQQQNQWYQMQQQQQQQQYEASGALQSEMQNPPVSSTQPMSLQIQTKVQQQDSTSNATWKGHDSEVDRLKSLFKKR